jgi:tetratricopeptide (TPR) repeat protein
MVLSALSAVLLFSGLGLPSRAADTESMADRALRKIVDRQKEVLGEAVKQGENLDESTLRQNMQSLMHDYELLVRNNPTYAAGYAAYGYFLSKTDMRKEAAAMLLKANQLDPNLAIVKNQLGNLLAEDGKPVQAAPYFMAAIKLEPNEALYHYQFGTLLVEARDEFLMMPEWKRDTLDNAMHEAFRRAAELAPNQIAFAYRYAESFYDLQKPDWEGALKAWAALEAKATTAFDRQTMRLHAANVSIKMGKPEQARLLLATVDEEKLQGQKQKLVAELAGTPKK